jgi:hypothetical protein
MFAQKPGKEVQQSMYDRGGFIGEDNHSYGTRAAWTRASGESPQCCLDTESLTAGRTGNGLDGLRVWWRRALDWFFRRPSVAPRSSSVNFGDAQ